MSRLRGSKSYIWNVDEVLGQGATGAVYKARHKRTGELFAVKTFNQMSHMRPQDVQMREFDVLKKLDHENIVRLLAIEDESTTADKVLVMELCTGGSVYNMLDDPENAYGLDESEFICILRDLASGMKHVRDQEIVHRDIKPGNIMRYITEDGRSIYKLIDFGAARELQDEEQFVSLYGTEEYLFPDMYERAVLRRPSSKQFTATVDLWSVGVTLYHVATGHLPFRPFGGRKNKELMYRITTEKAAGVISGIQEIDQGPIVWKKSLPEMCRLSEGMKRLVTPLLAGLLESDQDRMMGFEQFFNAVIDIGNKQVVYVFNVTAANILHIYIDRKQRLAEFQELIAEQTEVRATEQQLMFENHELDKIISPMQYVQSYPSTSVQNPMYLFSTAVPLVDLDITPTIPGMPSFTTEVQLESDALLAKNCCAVVYHLRRVAVDAILKQQLTTRAAKMYLLLQTRDIELLRDGIAQFTSLIEEIGRRIKLFSQSHELLSCTLPVILRDRGRDTDLAGRCLTDSYDVQKDVYNKLRSEVQEMRKKIDLLYKQTSDSDDSKSTISWLDEHGCKETDNCVRKADILVDALKQTVGNFARDRLLKKLSFNEEQIHKFDKHKLKVNATKALSLAQDHCLPNNRKIFQQFVVWYSDIRRIQNDLETLQTDITKAAERQKYLSLSLNEKQDDQDRELSSLLGQLDIQYEAGQRTPDPSPEMKQTKSRRSDVINDKFEFILRHQKKAEQRQKAAELKKCISDNSGMVEDITRTVDDNQRLLQIMSAKHGYIVTNPYTSNGEADDGPPTLIA